MNETGGSGNRPDSDRAQSTAHYFDAAPAVTSRPHRIQLTLPDVSMWLVTDRGVFSGERVDPGTKLLLMESAALPATGNLLDLGCGYGPIAATMAARSPCATVWAVDVNSRARDLCRQNTAAFGNVTVVTPEDVPADVRFDAVWSNPPIRIGKPALHALLAHWLGCLTPDGLAALVVQRHLGADSLAAWLTSQGFRVSRRASRQSYRLLDVNPRPDGWHDRHAPTIAVHPR